MVNRSRLLVGAAAFGLAALTACAPKSSAPLADTLTLAQEGCLRDVASTTNNPDVATRLDGGVSPQHSQFDRGA